MRVGPLTAVVAVIACGVRPVAQRGACVGYSPHVASLDGVLREEVRYGPPNYGEDSATDSRINVTFLILDRPIDMCGQSTSAINADSLRGVGEVQLLNVAGDSSSNALLGRKVTAVGELEEATFGPEYTRVVMTVRKLTRRPE